MSEYHTHPEMPKFQSSNDTKYWTVIQNFEHLKSLTFLLFRFSIFSPFWLLQKVIKKLSEQFDLKYWHKKIELLKRFYFFFPCPPLNSFGWCASLWSLSSVQLHLLIFFSWPIFGRFLEKLFSGKKSQKWTFLKKKTIFSFSHATQLKNRSVSCGFFSFLFLPLIFWLTFSKRWISDEEAFSNLSKNSFNFFFWPKRWNRSLTVIY